MTFQSHARFGAEFQAETEKWKQFFEREFELGQLFCPEAVSLHTFDHSWVWQVSGYALKASFDAKNNCGHAPKNCLLTSSQITKFNLNLPLNFHIFKKKKILAIATNRSRWVKKLAAAILQTVSRDDRANKSRWFTPRVSRNELYYARKKNLKWPSDGPLLMWIIDRLSELLPPIWTWTLIFGCFILPCKRSLWLKRYFRVLHRSLRTPTFQLLRSLVLSPHSYCSRFFFRKMQEWKIATMRIFRVSLFDWLPAMFFFFKYFLGFISASLLT